ncbi:MAG TPA: efflux RND transporter periplasmic adaptor subunit [Candidatus Binataceae bacterium]|jgi:multidrug efflux pump subunit AcrA (membrane-fusion protein)|nr:efflux RND transporter periplasmic adaptor subunit [Candidatus Binataceae bacterium]
MTRIATAVAVGALMLTACFACQDRDAPPAPARTQTVMVTRPRRQDAVRQITLPGDLTGFFQATLYAKVTGYLRKINVDKGDWIRNGEVLAEIEVPELQDRLAHEQARLKVRQLTYERLERVWKSDPRLIAREDVDIANGNYQESLSNVAELKAMMKYTRIIAPFDGVVTARFVDPGALIQASGGQPTFELGGSAARPRGNTTAVVSVAMINLLRVYVYVPEEAVGKIRRLMPAALALREYPGRRFRGSVARFATALDLSTRTMLTEVDVENPRHELYPGMYANVTINLENRPGALTVPPSAVGGTTESAAVYIVRDSRLQKVDVTTGIRTGDYVEITSGLMGNELVVNNFTPALVQGEQVRSAMMPNSEADYTASAKQ